MRVGGKSNWAFVCLLYLFLRKKSFLVTKADWNAACYPGDLCHTPNPSMFIEDQHLQVDALFTRWEGELHSLSQRPFCLIWDLANNGHVPNQKNQSKGELA